MRIDAPVRRIRGNLTQRAAVWEHYTGKRSTKMRHAVESNRANFFRPAFTRPLRLAPPPCLVLEIPHRSQRCTFLAQGRIYAVPSVAYPPGHLQFCFSPPTFSSVSGL